MLRDTHEPEVLGRNVTLSYKEGQVSRKGLKEGIVIKSNLFVNVKRSISSEEFVVFLETFKF